MLVTRGRMDEGQDNEKFNSLSLHPPPQTHSHMHTHVQTLSSPLQLPGQLEKRGGLRRCRSSDVGPAHGFYASDVDAAEA